MSRQVMPQLFIFGRILEHCLEEPEIEEVEAYSEQLETDWLRFWRTRGVDIVNASWSHAYSEYMLKEKENNLKDSEDSSENSVDNQLQEETGGPTWQELWEEHHTEIYTRTYQLFLIVHYHQYCFYRPNIEEILEEIPESEADDLDLVDQRQRLKELGLPTSFIGRRNKNHNSGLYSSCSESVSGEEEEERKEAEEMSPSQKQTPQKQRRKKKNRKLRRIPKVILEDKSLRSYWHKRFSLFLRFDEGIQLDRESWFSVTPEKVAIHMAERLRCDTIIDAFCGSGGNAIQFAFTCSKVIAIDIDPEKIKNARHNAGIYGVADKIDFIIGDFLQLCGKLKGDVVFLSPPWGGPKYISKKEYDIEESLAPLGATALAEKSRQISENIAFFLPKNSNPQQIVKLAGIGNRVEIEHNYLNTRLVGLTAIYGAWLIDKENLSNKVVL